MADANPFAGADMQQGTPATGGPHMPGDNPSDPYPDPVAHPIRYLASTEGADVMGAVHQVGRDVTDATGPAQGVMGAVKKGAAQVALPFRMAYDVAQVPMTAIIGGPIHAGFIRPLAQIEYASLASMSGGHPQTVGWDGKKHDVTVESLEHDISLGLMAVGPEATEAGVAARAGLRPEDVRERVSMTPEEVAKQAAAKKQGRVQASAAAWMARRSGLRTAGEVRSVIEKGDEVRERTGHDPALMDVVPQKTRRFLRGVTSKLGDADDVMEAHRRAVRKDVPDQVQRHAESISPYGTEPVEQRATEIEKQRDALAREKYPVEYAKPIQTDEHLLDMLDYPEGHDAISAAARTARAWSPRDPAAAEQVKELQSLRQYFDDKASFERRHSEWERTGGSFETEPTGTAKETLESPDTAEWMRARLRAEHGWKEIPEPQPPQPPIVSGGALDRLRMEFRDTGNAKMAGSDRGVGAAMKATMHDIDGHLDTLQHLTDARAEYRDMSKRARILRMKIAINKMTPEEFKAMLADMNDAQRQELAHTVSQTEARAAGESTASAQALENALTTSPNAKANLSELLGKQKAAQYLRALELEKDRVQSANFVASSQGSKSIPSSQDVGEAAMHVGLNLLHGRGTVAAIWLGKWLRGRLFSDDDAALQIAEWVTKQQNVRATLQEIVDAFDKGQVPSRMPARLAALISSAGAAQLQPHEKDQPPPDDANPFSDPSMQESAAPSPETPAPTDTAPADAPKDQPADAAPTGNPPSKYDLASLKIDPTNLTSIPVPGASPVRVNAAIAPYVSDFLTELAARYPIVRVVGVDGHNRDVAGTNVESAHHAGLAIDVNPDQNRGANTEFDPTFVRALCAKYGCKWGHDFHNPDSMHFTWSSASGGQVPWTPSGARGPMLAASDGGPNLMPSADASNALASIAAFETQ